MEAEGAPEPATPVEGSGSYPSMTPQYHFADDLTGQRSQLEHNPLMVRFAESRQRMASDRYRPAYHFVSPESTLNDPNGLTYWQGRWHLFYQAYPPDEFPDASDVGKRRQHWGHAVSDDLVRWTDLPYAIYPGIEKMVFSGATVVDGDRVVAFYPGIAAGQMVAVSSDPLLLNWDKSGPLEMDDVGDSHIWKEGDTFFGLVGGVTRYYPEESLADRRFFHPVYGDAVGIWPKTALWSSQDLVNWHPEGDLLLEATPFASRFDEACCPYFLRIGDRHILLYVSHKNGAQYFLGNYDEATHRFRPYDHGRFNHGQMWPDGVHAPSAAEDGDGGVVNILNINSGTLLGDGWDHIMSLPQRLTLGDDARLCLEPIPSVASLRAAHVTVGETVIPGGRELLLPEVRGDSLELDLEIDTQRCRRIELDVLRSAGGEERTSIVFYNRPPDDFAYSDLFDEEFVWTDEQIVLDGTRSTLSGDTMSRPPEQATVRRRDGENLELRVFVDRSVVEVFVNGRQYLAIRVYPSRTDSVGVSLRCHGGSAVLTRLDAWQMTPIWPITRPADE
jgi:beta-fructofuranosidase